MSRYALVQESLAEIDPQVLQDALIEHGKMALADASRAARKNRGILTEHLTLQQAAAVCGALKQRGFEVRAVPTEKLPPKLKPRLTRWLEIEHDALLLPMRTTGPVARVPWQNVFVVNAGQVAELKEEERLETKTRMTWRNGAVVTDFEFESDKISEMVHVTEIIATAESGKLVHARLPARGMNYNRILGPETSSQGYFKKYLTLVERIVHHSTAALVSPETLELLRERDMNREKREGDYHVYAEERRFSEYTRWLLQLVIFRENEKLQS